MPLTWPRIALIDSNNERCFAWELSAKAIGMTCRPLAAIPTTPDVGRRHVRVLVVHPSESSFQMLRKARVAFPCARVIVSGIDSSQISAVEAFRAGADDFICFESGAAERSALLSRHLALPGDEAADQQDHGGLVGDGRAMRDLRAFVRRLAPSSATVLITGETGTGKDCAATLLHRLSRRAKGPLVALNCAAIPEALLEGELFGYERGAFSGALSAYPGKLKLADGGTLFLDEIGELSLTGQAKVLRAIETREAYRLGARVPTRFDVRIVAATNRNLADERDAGRFREDLFYRLAVAQLHMPPLRDRREDIAPIARHLLRDLAVSAGLADVRIDDAAMAKLEAYHWPGNVRELRNSLEVAMLGSNQNRIRPGDLPPNIAAGTLAAATPLDERTRLLDVLARAGGNKSLAAQELNCSRMTLYRRLARHGVADEAERNDIGVTPGDAVSLGLSQAV